MALVTITTVAVFCASAMADPFGEPFRVSITGADSNGAVSSFNPSFAYNTQTGQYLAVWSQDLGSGPTIAGQLRDATGGAVGNVFSVSDPPPTCTPDPSDTVTCSHEDPVAAYNPDANEFYVVWHRVSDATGSKDCSNNESGSNTNSTEIRGQRISAAGAQVGPHDVLISSTSVCARDPQVSYSSTSKRYLVSWSDEGNTGPIHVFAQRVDPSGTPMSLTEIKVSDDSGAVNNAEVGSAWDSVNDRWLIVWGRDGGGGISGQRLDPSGSLVGANFDISTLNPSSNPSVVFNAKDDQFLVAWRHDIADDPADSTPATHDIRAQRLMSDGTRIGTADFRVDNGAAIDNGAPTNDATDPSVAWDSIGDQYALAWQSNAGAPIQGQTLAADGSFIGTRAYAISTNSGDEEARTLVYNPRMCEYLVGWERNFSAGKIEIFARRLAGFPCSDLSLTNIGAPATVVAGSNITYTVKVTNAGPSPAPNTHVLNGLPAATTLVAVTSSQGACPNSAAVTCDLGTLAPSATATVTYIVKSTRAGTVTDVAAASSDGLDNTPADNSATATTGVTAAPLPVVNKPAPCRKRQLRIRPHARKGVKLVKTTITVDGRRVRVKGKKRRASALVTLPTTSSGTVTVKIVSVTSSGKKIKKVRHYRTCRRTA